MIAMPELENLAKSYGKFWCTCLVLCVIIGAGDRVPLGAPALMISPQPQGVKPRLVRPDLVHQRDAKYHVSSDSYKTLVKRVALSNIMSLAEINLHLTEAQNTGGVCFSLGKGMYRVLYIPEDEAVLLNSREKAPYMICVEVLRCDMIRTRPVRDLSSHLNTLAESETEGVQGAAAVFNQAPLYKHKHKYEGYAIDWSLLVPGARRLVSVLKICKLYWGFMRPLNYQIARAHVLCDVIESERAVSREEGLALAKELGCLLLESSAKTRENVEQCFEELALKVQF
ncbi:hypothetical protein AHAS_Ahas04G0202100 [Arachis hypogaea]